MPWHLLGSSGRMSESVRAIGFLVGIKYNKKKNRRYNITDKYDPVGNVKISSRDKLRILFTEYMCDENFVLQFLTRVAIAQNRRSCFARGQG